VTSGPQECRRGWNRTINAVHAAEHPNRWGSRPNPPWLAMDGRSVTAFDYGAHTRDYRMDRRQSIGALDQVGKRG